jgi:hypothetical protein
MHKSATKCNKTIGKWCKNKHGASKIIDTLETYQTAAALRNCSGKNVIHLGLGLREALNKRRGGVRGPPRGPHHPWARPGEGAPPHGEAVLWPLSSSLSVHVPCPEKIGVSVFGLSNSENISRVAFLKHKTAENRELALWHLVSRLVPEIA